MKRPRGKTSEGVRPKMQQPAPNQHRLNPQKSTGHLNSVQPNPPLSNLPQATRNYLVSVDEGPKDSHYELKQMSSTSTLWRGPKTFRTQNSRALKNVLIHKTMTNWHKPSSKALSIEKMGKEIQLSQIDAAEQDIVTDDETDQREQLYDLKRKILNLQSQIKKKKSLLENAAIELNHLEKIKDKKTQYKTKVDASIEQKENLIQKKQ